MSPVQPAFDALRQVFENAGLQVIFRGNDEDLWRSTSVRRCWQHVELTDSMLDYYFSYFGPGEPDLSCCICAPQGTVLAVWPLSLFVQEAGLKLTSIARPICCPIMTKEATDKQKIAIMKSAVTAALTVVKTCGATPPVFLELAPPGRPEFMNAWHLALLEAGAQSRDRFDLYVDLSLKREGFWRKLRKSYRALINKSQTLWDIDLICADTPVVWQEFKDLHREVAGRVTRSDDSWDKQQAQLAKGEAFLVTLRDRDARLVGAGFFNTSQDEALYSVAAYDRSLFAQPLGHAVQMRALEHLWTTSCKWYRLGEFPVGAAASLATDKERSIAQFKRGFATHIVPRRELLFSMPDIVENEDD